MTTVTSSYVPVWRFADNNNNPLVGGKVYTYYAGTTTPAATYTDATGSTPLTNPIILNARGETANASGASCSVWFSTTIAYKIVVQDSSGNLIWTVDNYTIPSQAYSAAYADTFTATAGQTVFTLTGTVGSQSALDVSLDGATLVNGVDFTWTSPSTLTLTVGAKAGQILLVKYLIAQAMGTMVAGGTSGQILYNNGGSVQGFTMSGDVTVVPTTGVATVNAPSSHITYTQGGTGATSRTVTSKLQESVSVLDFGADPTGVADSTAAIQAAINTGASVYLPTGTYKITSTLTFPNTVSVFRGDGRESSIISCNGVTGAVLKAAAITYFRPQWQDFAIAGNSSTGIGIDLSAVTSEVYDGRLRDINITCGGDGLYALNFFSMTVDNVLSTSYNGHSFRVACGPAVSWINCYAAVAGSGKAGYRLAGTIAMYSCNGVNTADFWGVFGSNPSGTDGWQNDFPSLTDYPDIIMIGCNVENFGSISTAGIGLQTVNVFKNFRIIGGKIDRAGLSTAYVSLINSWQSFSSANAQFSPVRLGVGNLFLGSGTPSIAYLTGTGGCEYVDENNLFIANGITSYRNTSASLTYPLVSQLIFNDVYGDKAWSVNAIIPRRLSVQMVRYATPAALTPVGAAQAIDVTGYTKVTVTPAAAASISTATFTQTIGAGLDYLRNGDLLIEAGNANLTINHTASGANTFRMAAAANLTLAAGQVVRFCWSSTSSQWIQV